MPMDFDYMTFNVGQGYLGANTHLGSIFFASNENSTIEFYSSDLKPIKKVVGPVSLPEARLNISGEDGKREIVYKGMLQPEAHRGLHVLLITCFSYIQEKKYHWIIRKILSHIFYVSIEKEISKRTIALLAEFIL